jgi:CheY-like chemotaxis protein
MITHSTREVAANANIQRDVQNFNFTNNTARLFNKTINILYVDDNRCNQELARQILNNIGCPLKMANNGHEALQMITREKFDMIFMDIEMPVMDGYQATVTIRRHLCLSIPIIALTTLDSPSDIESCLQVGMNDHITKPIQQVQLLSSVFEWASHK